MSRIGKRPITVPKGVKVTLHERTITVHGPKGRLERVLPPEIEVAIGDGTITVTRPTDTTRHRALHGLTRSLVANMVEGVTTGFSKALEIQGVGYRAESRPTGVRLLVGYSHAVEYQAPAGIQIAVENPTSVVVSGVDKELVGQVAADLRGVRGPEPYKGKGIRYVGEHVRRKAGKTGGKA